MDGIIAWIDKTMLVERLMGVGAYALLVAVVYLLIKKHKSYRTINLILNSAIVVLCVMAFFFVTNEFNDLYRLLELGHLWEDYTLKEFVTGGLLNTTTPLSYLMIYLCSQFGVDGLLPAVSTFIFYMNIFHILKDLYRRTDISNHMLALDFLFFMSAGAFLEVVSGIRCFMALSIVVRCIYDETVREKNILWNTPWYLAAAMLHLACIPVIIIRVLFLVFFEKKRGTAHIIISLLVVAVAAVVAIRYGQTMFINMFVKAESYLTEDSYSYTWEYLIGVIQWGLMASVLYSMRGYSLSDHLGLKNSKKFLTVFLIINILFCFEYNIFHRFMVVSAAAFMPMLAMIPEEDTPRFRALKQRIFYVSLMIFAIAAARGNLCGYKFFLFE